MLAVDTEFGLFFRLTLGPVVAFMVLGPAVVSMVAALPKPAFADELISDALMQLDVWLGTPGYK